MENLQYLSSLDFVVHICCNVSLLYILVLHISNFIVALFHLLRVSCFRGRLDIGILIVLQYTVMRKRYLIII
jgi:hypothetical protein